jgi:ribosomal protein L21E
MVKNWADKEYERNWFGLREDQVKNLAKNARTKLGFGNFISTVESVPEYRLMSDTKQPFLYCSATFPHPVKTDEPMRIMIYANPSLLGLLQGVVDIFVDATVKPCTPYGFYQCLILMVYDNQTSSYVPIVYALMSHKKEALYNQVFLQLKCVTNGKMEVRTYTSDFERAEMNMLAEHFPKGIHVGCFFYFKQALVKYLKDHGMGYDSVSFKPAIEVGGLDILCVLPRYVK